jgi:glycosyltransferase involved in cell wall biosynthesis
MLISIFAVPNGVGISRDVAIIQSVLKANGHEVDVNHIYRYTSRKKYDLGIFLERFKPELFSESNKNVMIPNQEWFEDSWLQYLKAFDCIFTKTKFADEVFKRLNCKTEFISFTSEDRYIEGITKDDMHYLHVAGKSVQKQTEILWRCWAKNPGLPSLTILQDQKFYKPRVNIRNVNYIYDRLPDDLLKTMQNSMAIHICPSETEGFGHYIMEAMSCKSLVLTTNAAPMNELVESNGIYIDVERSEPLRLSVRNTVTEDSIKKAVLQSVIMDGEQKRKLGEMAREKFLKNDEFFRKRLAEAINTPFE